MADPEPVTDVYTKIMQDYPTLGYLLNVDPAVAWLVVDAVNPDHPFDAATFQAKLMQTDWWKTTTDSQRAWEKLSATDPATAQQNRDQWRSHLNEEATKMGVELKPADLDWWTEHYLPQGVASDDPTILNELARVYQQRPDLRTGTGSVDTVKDQMRQIASTYFRDLTPADLDWWGAQITSGQQTIQNFQTVIQNQARDRFPMYRDEINSGVSPEQLFAQQKQAIASTLEVDPSTIDLAHDPRWSKVLGTPDKDGKLVPMSYSDAMQLARAQPEWRNTINGRQASDDLVKGLLSELGAVKY